MLANVSPHKEEKISLVRQGCDDGRLWPVLFPSDIQTSPFCPWKRDVHTLIGIQRWILCIQQVHSVLYPLTCSLHKPLPFFFFFLLLHWVFSSDCGQQSTQLSIPSSSLSSAQWPFVSSPSEREQKHTVRDTLHSMFKRLWNGFRVHCPQLLKPDLLRHGCRFPQSRQRRSLPAIPSHCPPYLRSNPSHWHCWGGINLEKHQGFFFTSHYLSLNSSTSQTSLAHAVIFMHIQV